MFSQQTYLINFLDFLSLSSFIPPQNVVYFLMLPFLVHKIYTFNINDVLNCKCPAPGPKGYCTNSCFIISLLYASTCFEHYVLIIRRSKLYYTASSIITPLGGRPVCRLREDCAYVKRNKSVKRINFQ